MSVQQAVLTLSENDFILTYDDYDDDDGGVASSSDLFNA